MVVEVAVEVEVEVGGWRWRWGVEVEVEVAVMLTPASSSNCFLIQSLCHTSLSIVTHDELARFKNMLRGADNNFVRQWYTGSEDRERLQQRCSDCVLALQAAIEKEKRKVSRLQRAGLYVTCYIFICAYASCPRLTRA